MIENVYCRDCGWPLDSDAEKQPPLCGDCYAERDRQGVLN